MYEVQVTFLQDGRIKIVTDGAVPEERHDAADAFMQFVREKAAGECNVEKLRETSIHHHEHGHIHHSQ